MKKCKKISFSYDVKPLFSCQKGFEQRRLAKRTEAGRKMESEQIMGGRCAWGSEAQGYGLAI
jgi:hypothetical protein